MKEKLKKYWFEIFLVAAGCVVTFLGFGGLLLGAHLGGSEDRALIGDFVGGTTTPLLTALTFIGVLVGIALQRRELIATRKELELTRTETANSAAALSDQAAAIRIQNFERTLFESLSFLNSISDGLKEQGFNREALEGRETFDRLYGRVSPHIRSYDLESFDLDSIRKFDDLAATLRMVSPKLAPYFRTLYNIYRYIDQSEFSDNRFYSRIVRAQLDDAFLAILFYNSLTNVGWKFQRYISKYKILDNLSEHYILDETHKHLFRKIQKIE